MGIIVLLGVVALIAYTACRILIFQVPQPVYQVEQPAGMKRAIAAYKEKQHREEEMLAEVMATLRAGRAKLAEEYGRRACTSGDLKHGHQNWFKDQWQEYCNLVRAKHGDSLTQSALNRLGLSAWR